MITKTILFVCGISAMLIWFMLLGDSIVWFFDYDFSEYGDEAERLRIIVGVVWTGIMYAAFCAGDFAKWLVEKLTGEDHEDDR
jgi:hypothetical protein